MPDIKVLIIDDDGMCLRVLSRLVAKLGYLSREASTFSEAMAVIKNENIDLLIVDQQMPEILGTQLIEHIRGEGFEMPAILISAHADVSVLSQGFVSHAFDKKTFFENLGKSIEMALASAAANKPPKAAKAPEKKYLEASMVGEMVTVFSAKEIRELIVEFDRLMLFELRNAFYMCNSGLATAGKKRVHKLRGSALSLGLSFLSDRLAMIDGDRLNRKDVMRVSQIYLDSYRVLIGELRRQNSELSTALADLDPETMIQEGRESIQAGKKAS